MHAKTNPVKISRRELYDRVWSPPMSRLGPEFGLSGNGLKKLCARHDIPVPPRGYWAKKAAGQRMAQYRLPTGERSPQEDIIIRPSPPPIPDPVIPNLPAGMQTIAVADQLGKPHAVIRNWRERHDRETRAARNAKNTWSTLIAPTPWSQMDRRQHRILDALFKGLERGGAAVTEDDRNAIRVNLGGEAVEIRLREKLKRIRRPLTDSEKRMSYHLERGWVQELVGSGKLAFEIRSWLPEHLKREWIESDTRPMESQLSAIVATLLAAAPIIEARRKREAEERREREAQATRQREIERLQRIDDNRWRRFLELAAEWEDVQRAQAYLAAVSAAADIDDPDLTTLQDWVEQRADSVSPTSRGGSAILAELNAVNQWSYRN
ncbi:hypothetical protein [Maricaulis sp.]|uniref:hypothetical protein n=1 Tax=Maricaulis sp. TaxID=1486257 RepID=UPI003A927FB3